ncbi:SRPBCC family protein [Streptomyces sp. NPDC093510]|uniref:aromatase/cyclase n=1 Tax=Streptomyces sp. NPDC093510 TaxID=3155199 RepID=UPI003445C812
MQRLVRGVEVAAPAQVVYALIADPERWPLFLPRTVYAQRLDADGVDERVRMWGLAEGQVMAWTSGRVLDGAGRRITFRQELPVAPAESMAGCWQVREVAVGRCRVDLEHVFAVAPARPQDAAYLREVVEATSRSALESLRFWAERWSRLGEVSLSFAETVRVKGPAELVYGFLYEVADWPGQVAHVRRAVVEEDCLGIQKVALELAAAEGGTPTVAGIRICFPHAGRIVHKATVPRPLLAAHCGEWSVLPDEYGVSVVCQHHVLLREDTIEQVLGPGAGLAEARRQVRAALTHESRQILRAARRHAESAIRTL